MGCYSEAYTIIKEHIRKNVFFSAFVAQQKYWRYHAYDRYDNVAFLFACDGITNYFLFAFFGPMSFD